LRPKTLFRRPRETGQASYFQENFELIEVHGVGWFHYSEVPRIIQCVVAASDRFPLQARIIPTARLALKAQRYRQNQGFHQSRQ
jgi:hypothetical protein